MTESTLPSNSTLMEDKQMEILADDEKSTPLEPVHRVEAKVRLFSVCDGGVVKIHIPACKSPICTDTALIDDILEHNALSSTSKKSKHDVNWPDEIHVDDPRNWPTWRKWMVTLIVSSISLCS